MRQTNGASAPPPKVSVLMITYNHERYIADAIQSALMQETAFEYEIVIGEDCSTDRTRAICRRFAERYPECIRLLPEESNLGMHRNSRRTYASCRGEYIAILEGDDFWTSRRKLQMQADLLDEKAEIVLSFHQVNRLDEQGRGRSSVWPTRSLPERTGVLDILQGDYVPTCSVMLRQSAVPVIPDWFEQLAMGDWPLWVLASQHGALHFTPEPMATYRLHSNGAWSSMDSLREKREKLRFYLVIESHVPEEHRHIVRQRRDEFIDAVLKEAAAYASSHSYRIGRTLLFPYRAVRQLLRRTHRWTKELHLGALTKHF
jgi:glycosyltransferase involved in cell wall biosynthesis